MTVSYKYVDEPVPKGKAEQDVVYIAEKVGYAAKLCACGCGCITHFPIADSASKFKRAITINDKGITIEGSFGWKTDCRSHYLIEDGEIKWCSDSGKWGP